MTEQQQQQPHQVQTWEDYDYDDDYDDDYDEYDIDDFQAGGRAKKSIKKQYQRGGGGSGTIYSAKHVRNKMAQRPGKTTTKAVRTHHRRKG